METFSVRDLRERAGDLIRSAQEGKLSVITNRGNPVCIAIPFDDLLAREGVTAALALRLFDEGQISLGLAARLTGMSRQAFTEYLGRLGIAVVRSTVTELEQELASFGT